MDSNDTVVIDTKREQQFSFSVEPINNTQEPPSSIGLRIHFLYVTKHRIFVSPSSSHETSSSLVHRHDESAKKLSGEFDSILLLSGIDIRSLGDRLSPLLSRFKIKQGGEDHMRIAREVKRVARRVVHERYMVNDLELLLSLRVTITRVYSTYHRCENKNNATDKVVKEIRVPVIDAERRVVGVKGEDECSFCLEKLRGVRSCVAMPCAHVFHTKCVEKWLQGDDDDDDNNRRSCPLCRFETPAFWQRPITDMYHFGYVLA